MAGPSISATASQSASTAWRSASSRQPDRAAPSATRRTSTPTGPATRTCCAGFPTPPWPISSSGSPRSEPLMTSSVRSSKISRTASLSLPRPHDRRTTTVRDSPEPEQDLAGQRTRAGRLGRLRRKSRRPPLVLADQPELSAAPPGPAALRRPGRLRRHRVVGSGAWLAVIPAGILAVLLTVHAVSGSPRVVVQAPRTVVASLPYWSIGTGTDAVLANRQDVNEASPWIYGLAGNGQIVLDSGISKAALARSLSQLRARGLPLVPTLANVDGQGNWTYPPVARILHDPVLMARHVAAIVALVDSG